jgi:hypothetical protein
MWKSDVGWSLTFEFLCCVVTCHLHEYHSLILVDFLEEWVGEVFGLSVCQSNETNPNLGGNMNGNPCWNVLSFLLYICKKINCVSVDKNEPQKLNIGGLNVFAFFHFFTSKT